MSNNIFDAEATYISSPLRLVLFICRHLIDRGYGGLRLFSYVKEGLGALRVGVYCEMNERCRNGERLACLSQLIGSFDDFHDRDYCEFADYASRRLSVAQAAEEYERKNLRFLEAYRAAPEQSYIDWYDGLLSICMEDGFPITEDPLYCGADRSTEIIFSEDSRAPVSYPQPPGFSSTIFPLVSNARWERARLDAIRAKEPPPVDCYAEWKRRVAEIERQARK